MDNIQTVVIMLPEAELYIVFDRRIIHLSALATVGDHMNLHVEVISFYLFWGFFGGLPFSEIPALNLRDKNCCWMVTCCA